MHIKSRRKAIVTVFIILLTLSIIYVGTTPIEVKADDGYLGIEIIGSNNQPIENAHVTVLPPNGPYRAINGGTDGNGQTTIYPLSMGTECGILATADNYHSNFSQCLFSTDRQLYRIALTPTIPSKAPVVWMNPRSGPSGTTVALHGYNFVSNEFIKLDCWGKSGLEFTAGADGSFITAFTIPEKSTPGTHIIQITSANTGYSGSFIFTVSDSPPTPGISLNPSSGPPGTMIKISGCDFSSYENLQLQLDSTNSFVADAYGEVSTTWTIPLNAALGSQSLTVFDTESTSRAFATATFTVTEQPRTITITALTAGQTTIVDHLTQTGIKLFITGSTLTDGQSITVTTIRFGQTQPDGTGPSFGSGAVFYDTQVLPAGSATLGQEVTVTLSISDPTFGEGMLLYYWNNANWVSLSNQVYDSTTKTLSGMIPASDMMGTPIMATEQTLVVTPEYPIGALLALAACLAAFIVYKKRQHPANTQESTP